MTGGVLPVNIIYRKLSHGYGEKHETSAGIPNCKAALR